MQNTPIAGLPWPELTDVPNAQTAFQNLATSLDPKVIASFASQTARDSAIPSPADGNMAYRQDVHGHQRYNAGTSRWETWGETCFADTVLAGSSTTTMTFSSIPQTARNLRLIVVGHSQQAATFFSTVTLTYNSLTGASYAGSRFESGNGASGAAATNGGNVYFSGQTSIIAGDLPGQSFGALGQGAIVIEIPGYSLTTFNKTVFSRSFAGDGGVIGNSRIVFGQYSGQNAAVTRLDLTIPTGFTAGTWFGLYGSN